MLQAISADTPTKTKNKGLNAMDKAIMTRCASRKFQAKQGMNKDRAQKQANKILKYGVTHKEAQGELKRFMTYLYFRCGSNNTRLYGDTAYLFDGRVIISQYRIPDRLVSLVKQMNAEKREAIDGRKPVKQSNKLTNMPWDR